MANNNRLAIMLTGVGIGAVAGLLLARSSGKDLRRGILKRAEEAKDLFKEQAETLADRVEIAGRSTIKDLGARATDAMETVAGAVTNATSDFLDNASTLAHKASKFVKQQA